MRDPYDILGVSKSASEAEIKKAFRNLAKKHHPDTHEGDDKAASRFQEISGAYDILGDKEKRAKFDRGEIDAQGNPRGFEPARTASAAAPSAVAEPAPASSTTMERADWRTGGPRAGGGLPRRGHLRRSVRRARRRAQAHPAPAWRGFRLRHDDRLR